MAINFSIIPSDPLPEVRYIGEMDKVEPAFNDDVWDLVGTVKAERVVTVDDWTYTSEGVPREIDPAREAFWMWGDVLVRVIPATILESGLYFFKTS